MRRISWIIFGGLFLLATAHADRVGYDKVVDLRAERDTVQAEHHHDWSAGTHDARWKMISTTKDPFTVDNDYSYLMLRDKITGAALFRRAVPALTHIWISPDSQYIVGISNIMLWNPYQLVVYSKAGDRLFERRLIDVNWPGVTQSVTNWIKWYKEPVPKMTIIEKGQTAILSIEDPLGILRQFQFNAAK